MSDWSINTILVAGSAFLLFALCAWGVIYYVTYAVRSQVLGETIWRGNTKINAVALTFDDGPSPDTLGILDILHVENVKATFFLVGGNVEKYPAIARKIIDDGHEIGNHSFSHPIFLFCASNKTRRELENTQEIIKNATGVLPTIARPPCGVRSPRYFAATRELGLQTIQWSDTGFDWKNISATKIAENVINTVQSGSIVLLHDGDSAGKRDRRSTVDSIPLILTGLRAKGLEVVPLRQLLSLPEVNEKGDTIHKISLQSTQI